MKIKLICPKTDKTYSHVTSGGFEILPPPTGLELIANNVYGDHQIDIYQDIDEKEFDDYTDVVGVQSWFTNHKTGMKILKKAKETNPKVITIVGGINATNLGPRILKNHEYVDFVVAGDGEKCFSDIVNKIELEKIPNIVYRREDQILVNPILNININNSQIFNLEHLVKTDLERLNSRGRKYSSGQELTPLPISLIRGCKKASSKLGRCIYCNIPSKGVRTLNPKIAWKQIELLHEKYGIKDFFETGDDFLVENYPQRLLKQKPPHLEVNFRIYTSFFKINQRQVKTLKKIGVKECFIGIEHVDPRILATAHRPSNNNGIENSIKILREYDIDATVSFLFGLPGETLESSKRNHEFAKKIYQDNSNVKRLLHTMVVPIIGSKLFSQIRKSETIQKEYCGDLDLDDDFDYAQLTKLMIRQNCSVEYESLVELIEEGKQITKNKTGMYGGIEEIKD